MKHKVTRKPRRMTRREFVGGALTAAGMVAGAPALLRGRNLNNKLDIAFIACGGRAKDNIKELVINAGICGRGRPGCRDSGRTASRRERRRAVRCESARAGRRVGALSKSQDVQRLQQSLRPPERLRRRRGLHRRAHTRVRDLPGADARQARLLREAAHLQHLGSAAHSRDGCEVPESIDADGQSGPRVAGAPDDQRNPHDGRDRSGSRGPRLGGTGLGPPGRRVGGKVRQAARVLQRHPDRRAVQGRDADSGNQSLRSVARTRAGAAVPRDVFPRASVVPLVGRRQRHDERSRQPRQRRAVHGAGHQAAADDRSDIAERTRAPGARAGDDDGDV